MFTAIIMAKAISLPFKQFSKHKTCIFVFASEQKQSPDNYKERYQSATSVIHNSRNYAVTAA